MNMFMDAIKQEQRRIQRVIDLTASSLAESPPGNLSLETRNGSFYCYSQEYTSGKRERHYVGTITSLAVQQLFNSRLQQERLKRLEFDHKLLMETERKYQNYDPLAVVASMPKSYRQIASQIDETFPAYTGDILFSQRYQELKAWTMKDFERNTTPFPDAENYARDGTRIRSKGECILYNLLQEFGILFRYDSVLIITDQNGRTKKVSPDFLIQCFDGSLIIIEHLGWLKDKGYAIDFGEKLYWYVQKGFFPGKNLFITSDDIHGGTDSQQILTIVKQVEQRFFGY